MLVQFMLKNVLSFREETRLDMSAIHAYKEHESNLIDFGGKEKILRVAAIYGANASGKSNLHLAMSYFQKIVKESLNNVEDGFDSAIKKYYNPFFFERGEGEESEFQIIEIIDNSEYRYGFQYDSERIITEWLYQKSLKTNRTKIIYERMNDRVEFGQSVRKECEVYKEQLPKETLVLSFFNKLKLKTSIFNNVYSGIMDTFVVPPDFCEDIGIMERYLPLVIDQGKNDLVEFLKAIDVGIEDIEYEDNDESGIEFFTLHRGKNDDEYLLNLFNESEGTLKSIILFIYARIAILNNQSLFVDELNIKLHPLLLKFVVDLFYNDESTAQLIYTTHDTTLMDKRFFRRDQIWFVQKDEFGYSELVALSDFKVRSDASFEKDYLSGVYGGIPLLQDFNMKEGV